MVLKGMDPDAVEQMAQAIEAAAAHAHDAYTRTQSTVHEFEWTGEDRERYVAEFEGAVGDAMQRIVQMAEEFSERARKNVTEQQAASA